MSLAFVFLLQRGGAAVRQAPIYQCNTKRQNATYRICHSKAIDKALCHGNGMIYQRDQTLVYGIVVVWGMVVDLPFKTR